MLLRERGDKGEQGWWVNEGEAAGKHAKRKRLFQLALSLHCIQTQTVLTRAGWL